MVVDSLELSNQNSINNNEKSSTIKCPMCGCVEDSANKFCSHCFSPLI